MFVISICICAYGTSINYQLTVYRYSTHALGNVRELPYDFVCQSARQMSVCIRKVLRSAIMVFLCVQASSETVPKFPVATACCSCRPPSSRFQFIEVKPLRASNYPPRFCNSPLIQKPQIPRPLSQVTASNVFTFSGRSLGTFPQNDDLSLLPQLLLSHDGVTLDGV